MQDTKRWMTALGLESHDLPSALILEGTWWESSAYEARTKHLNDPRELGFPGWIHGTYEGVSVVYVCAYGAPKAVEPVHVLGSLGTKTVMQIGSCGGLHPEYKTGDIVVPYRAEIGEGASQYYGGFGVALGSRTLQRKAMELLEARGMTVRDGHHITTSALFAQPDELVRQWSEAGYSSVDMETSAVYSAAAKFGMQSIALLYVWDELLVGRDFLDSFSEDEMRRQKTANEATFEAALELARRSAA